MEFSKIKYLLACHRSEALYDNKPIKVEVPEGFKKSFEVQDNFRGWVNYHVTWDVFEDDPWKCVLLKKSQEQEWDEVLEKVCPVITPEGEIVEAEEWERRSRSMN